MFSATEANTPTQYTAAISLPGAAASKRERDTPPSKQAGERPGKLSEAEERKLRELRETDARVRRHEEAHRAAAGALYRGGPNYTYETGPDGKRYAVAGSVQIDTSPGRTPEETVQKAARIRRAALAPMDPSGTDRAVASKATRMEDAARRAVVKKSMERPDAPKVTSNAPAETPIAAAPPPEASEKTAATQARSTPEPEARADAQPEPKAEARSSETLSPGDLGGEVWSTVSALSDSTQLKQERRADEMPMPAPHIDVMA